MNLATMLPSQGNGWSGQVTTNLREVYAAAGGCDRLAISGSDEQRNLIPKRRFTGLVSCWGKSRTVLTRSAYA
jgi:hypothetical protein